MLIIGIDPGFEKMGCAVLEKTNKGEKLIFSTCVLTDKKTQYEKRLLRLGKEIEKIIIKYKPDILSIEKLFFTTNQKTALMVSEARGVILYIASLKNIPIVEFTPLQVKIALTGYGKAEKKQVQKMVQSILKLDSIPKSDDETDAIAVALTCSATIQSQRYPQKF